MQPIEAFKKIWRGSKWCRLTVLLLILAGVLLAPIPSGRSYKGKVIDVQTGQPVDGAVVVGYWTYVIPTPVQGSTRCLDAREAVTDENGEFRIPAIRGLFFGMIGRFTIVFYKVGYQKMLFYVSDEWEKSMSDLGVWEDNRALVQLRHVDRNKLRGEGDPPHISCGRKDGKPLSAYREVQNEYRRSLGMKPFKF